MASPPALIDTHCHLDLADYDTDRGEVLARAAAAGVRAVINPTIGLKNMGRVLELAKGTNKGTGTISTQLGNGASPLIYVAAGIHPHSAADVDDACLAAIRGHAADCHVVAIGEIGLDYFPRYLAQTPAEVQRPAFEAQLALAAELRLPLWQ